MNIVVAGIGTGVGKTVISAVLVEALKADYWKPVQAGDLDKSDTMTVKSLVSNSSSRFHAEAYQLKHPMSPHAAAKLDSTEIDLKTLALPATKNRLVIELAGGIMVPLNNRELNLDLLKTWDASVVLVSRNYLGSINHSLLSLEVLKQHKVPLAGIIFNGTPNAETERFILDYSQVTCLARIEELKTLAKEQIRELANRLKLNL